MTKQKKFAINFTLFKIIGVYQLVDPSSKQIFGLNVYHLANITLIAFTTIMTIFGLSGFCFKIHDTYKHGDLDVVLIIFYLLCITFGNLKIIMIMTNADKIWSLFDISRKSFLSNRHCRRHFYKVAECGVRLSHFFNRYFYLTIITLTSYAMIPVISNVHFAVNNQTQCEETITRKNNILNLRYPIAAETYNAFYAVFYATELILAFYTGFGIFAFDLFAMSLLRTMAAQYEVIASACEAVEQREDNEDGTALSEEDRLRANILSIILDSQNIFKQLKIFYDIIYPIGLVQILADASAMICMPYLIFLSFLENGSFFNIQTTKFVCTLLIGGVQSFMYCSLFQKVNDKKESLNFRLYCCDWTKMDIRIQKIILLKMRFNNSSNYLKINLTPTKCIDLPLLAYVIRSSYSILSVMVKRKLSLT